jgi:AsmA protein
VRKMTKYLLAGLSVLLLVLVLAVCLIPVLVDPNDYKTDIASLIKDKTGRDVSFEGDITVSVFPWIGLKTGKMVVSNSPGFQNLPFITVAKSDVKVKLLPLLSQRFEVNTITLEGLILNLVKDKQGVKNWEDLVAPNQPPSTAAIANRTNQSISPPSALAALTVGGISIQNAQVNWDNQQTGERLELKNIHFTADKFTFGEPVKIDLVMNVFGKDFKFPGAVKLTTGLRVDRKLDNFVLSDSHLEWVGANKLASGQSLAVTITAPNATVNITQQTFKLSDLQLQSGDIKLAAEISGTRILDKPYVQGSVVAAPFKPSIAMKQWGIALPPAMRDAKALTNLGMSFHFQANPDQVEFTNLDVALDNSHGKGSVTIKDFAQPTILFDVAVDTVDVDRYFAQPEKSSKPIVSPGMAFAAGTFSLPLEWLRKLDAEGKLALGKLTFNRMTLQDMYLTLSSKKGIVKVEQTAKKFYQGSYSGNLHVDARADKSSLALNEKFTNIHLEPFLKAIKGEAKLGGTATLSTQLQGQGSNPKEVRSNLTGQVNFFLKDGYIKGFNLQKMVENGKNLVKGGALPVDTQHDQTAFSKISGTATINKGLLQNNDLIANTAKLRSTGKGNVNLDTERLDYKILTKLLKAEATSSTPEQVHDTPIGIHLGGTFSKPTYTLDVAALLTDKNKAKIEHLLDKNKVKIDKLMDKLDKELGPGVGDLLKKIF